MTHTWALRRLHAVDDAQIDGLADVLIDCVEGGASVSFMHPLARERAVAFWRRVGQGVAAAGGFGGQLGGQGGQDAGLVFGLGGQQRRVDT